MDESERESFLAGITTERTSTSMSTVVPMPPKATQPTTILMQILPPPEERGQRVESGAVISQQDETGDVSASSNQPAQTEAGETIHKEAQEADMAQQDEVTGNASDQGTLMEVSTVGPSEIATAGSSEIAEGHATDTAAPLLSRNRLRNYRMGSLHLDSYVDIFNILAASASRFTDPQGTYVRRLSLDDLPYQLRATLYNQDPVIVLVDAEIEQALLSMMGDTTKFREVYATEGVIDWVMFQYHLSVMQHMAPLGWTAPGYRAGGRFPMAVQDICQNLISHNPFANCHTTSMKDWRKVRHMLTLKRDEGTRIDYVTTAIRALCQYNEMATHSSSEVQQQMLDAALLDYADWAPELENMQESFRTGVPPANLPSERVEEMERQSREAEQDLIQHLDREDEANARKRERSKKRKDRKARSSDPEEAQPTVALREYKPPSEDDEGVARQLDFDTESQPQQTTVREPDTPEALRTQPAQNLPSSNPAGQGDEAAKDSTEQDPGHDPGPPPQDVDAPERVEEQGQSKENNDQAEKEPEKNSGEGHGSSRQPPDPPEPSDPDEPSQPSQILMKKKMRRMRKKRMEKDRKRARKESIMTVKRRKKRRWMRRLK